MVFPGFLLVPYGFPLVFLWFPYGFPMVFLRFPFGFLRVFHGFPMVFLLFSKLHKATSSYNICPAAIFVQVFPGASTFISARRATNAPNMSNRQMICANPYCQFQVHPQSSYGGFCCKKCHLCHVLNRCQPEHGHNCCRLPAPAGEVRAEATPPQCP